jgi:hypothetical protein
MTQQLSRRTFLQLTGIITLSTSLLPSFARAFSQGTPRREYARLLRPRISPDGRTRLLPNTVVRLTESGIAEHGWLKSTDIQTMPNFQPGASITRFLEIGQLAQVAMPSAPLYGRCDTLSPVTNVMGYSSGAWVADILPAAHRKDSSWVQLADDDGRFLGWSQSHLWRSVDASEPSRRFERITIDRSTQMMTLFDGSDEAASWAVSTSDDAWTGRAYAVSRFIRNSSHTPPFAWSVNMSNEIAIGGADWHNEFGTSHSTAHVEMHPYLAQWLYHHLADEATIDII